MSLNRLLPALSLPCLLVPLAAQTDASHQPSSERQPVAEARRIGFDSIEPDLCREWLTYLASDELEGRETGQPGYKLAAEFVAKRFAQFGLKPVGDDGTYFQQVPFFSVGPNVETSYLAVVDAEGNELLRVTPGQGLGGSISEESDREVELVHLIAKTTEDVENANLEGKAVLLEDQSPKQRRGTEASRAIWSAQMAAILTADDAAADRVQRQVSSGGGGSTRIQRGRMRFPNRYAITAAAAEKIAAAAASQSGLRLVTHIEVVREPVFAANVVGLLEGSDPTLKAEIVGIGSHLDHIGARGEIINNGADDDGSGTTGVLAVARAFHLNPTKPRRSILFMCFSGEEKGLVGSRYYADNPIFPNENMVAELQMDMIGRREEFVDRSTGVVTESADDNINTLHLVGTEKLSKDLHETCLRLNEAHVGFEFEFDEEDVFGRSDHANFARKDIPIAFFFTGFHPQYHQPDDTVDRIDFPKLARVAQLVYSIGFEVADREERPVRDRLWSEIPREGGRR